MNKYVNLVEQTLLKEMKEGTYDDINTVIELIKKDCKPFLKHKTIIWRGMYDKAEMGFRSVRKDRKPKDSSVSQDLIMNAYLKERGLPLRSKSMFATTDQGMAMVYGEEYLVFPIGNFKSVYFSEVEDMYSTLFVVFPEDTATIDQLADYADDNWEEMKADGKERDLRMLFDKSIFEHVSNSILKGKKVEDAINAYIDLVENTFRGFSGWNEEVDGQYLEEVLDSIHGNFWGMLNSGYKTNDIKGSDGNELIIDCQKYYYLASHLSDKNGNQIDTVSLVEKELGIREI